MTADDPSLLHHISGETPNAAITWTFRTYDDVQRIARFVGDALRHWPCFLGLIECMCNAIEHGNLALNFEEKQHLVKNKQWQSTIQKKLQTPPYHQRVAQLILRYNHPFFRVDIIDQGAGFNWRPYLDGPPSLQSSSCLCGRGIQLARLVSFVRMVYHDPGNHMTAYIPALPEPARNDGLMRRLRAMTALDRTFEGNDPSFTT